MDNNEPQVLRAPTVIEHETFQGARSRLALEAGEMGNATARP
ncbi:hypothetical protein N5C60_13720 [Pseudomonas mosselii]|nr:hypothetical protein [Pseudomonas mosselii]MDH1145663.1 hypothetical protein [Pseudomonas mosselii]